MSVATFGSVANRLVGRRKTRGDEECPTDPVRSYSYDIDDHRANPGKPIGDGSPGQGWAFKQALISTLKDLCTMHKTEGYEGPHKVQPSFLRSFERILDFLDHKTGDFFVSYQRIANDTGQSRSNVITMVECVEHWGFMDHVRRSEKVEDADGQPGPRRKQACNGYLFNCERRMEKPLWAIFWRRLMSNLKRLQGAAVRAAAFLKRSFNTVAQPAPRAAGKELAQQLTLLDQAVARRDAVGSSASP